MRVRYFAFIRKYTGCAEEDVPCQDTIGALARSLCERYGEKLRQQIFPNGYSEGNEEFGSEIIVLINGRHIKHLQGPASPLKPDDCVDIFPVVAGG